MGTGQGKKILLCLELKTPNGKNQVGTSYLVIVGGDWIPGLFGIPSEPAKWKGGWLEAKLQPLAEGKGKSLPKSPYQEPIHRSPNHHESRWNQLALTCAGQIPELNSEGT